MTDHEHDAGFTLVELLVVLVIMPLIIGAIAAAIIISEEDSGTTGNRLADSANAQITSEYFVGDVQGTQYVTTSGSASSPSVCVNPDLTKPELVLGLYRPAPNASATGPSVGYWVTTGPHPELVRDSCQLSASGTTTYTDQVIISDDTSQPEVSTTIAPSNFATDAGATWVPISATTNLTSSVTLPGNSSTVFSLPVTSTAGFLGSQSLTVRTTAGNQAINCPAPQPPTNEFTNCTSNDSGTAPNSAVVYQPQSISVIGISVTEPGSNYTYSLQASPRTLAARSSGVGQGAGTGAVVVSLSSLTLSGNATLTVQGSVDVNDSLDTTSLTGAGLQPPGVHVNTGPVTDPLEPFLPSAPTTTGPTSTPACTISTTTPQTLSPGEYSDCPLVLESGADVTLNPGVYQLDQGIIVEAGATLSTSGGVLLYLPPCTAPCSDTASFATGASVTIAPLNETEALAASGNPTGDASTALQDVWFWQASSGKSSLIGNGQGSQTSGYAYAPDATIDLSNSTGPDATGEIVAQNITMAPSSGSASLLVTGL